MDFVWPGFEAFVNPTVVSHLSDKLRDIIKRYQNKIENPEVEIEATPKVKQEQLRDAWKIKFLSFLLFFREKNNCLFVLNFLFQFCFFVSLGLA